MCECVFCLRVGECSAVEDEIKALFLSESRLNILDSAPVSSPSAGRLQEFLSFVSLCGLFKAAVHFKLETRCLTVF